MYMNKSCLIRYIQLQIIKWLRWGTAYTNKMCSRIQNYQGWMTTDENITGISNFWSANTSFFLTYCSTDLVPEIYYFSSFVVLLVPASRKEIGNNAGCYWHWLTLSQQNYSLRGRGMEWHQIFHFCHKVNCLKKVLPAPVLPAHEHSI